MYEHEKWVLEGLLFLSGSEGLGIKQLNGCAEKLDKKKIEVVLDELMQDYPVDVHGVELVRFGGICKFVSKEVIHPCAQELFSSIRVATLSDVALETSIIIVYKQPITHAKIKEARGVSCDMMVCKLLARNLVKECGRGGVPGRPFLHEVAEELMSTFKLVSLEKLPEPPDSKDTAREEPSEE